MISSIEAYRYLRATMTECSRKAGWRSLLLRAYDDPGSLCHQDDQMIVGRWRRERLLSVPRIVGDGLLE
jgi:hypothetical protein